MVKDGLEDSDDIMGAISKRNNTTTGFIFVKGMLQI
jgi:hypothetical protein